MKDQIRHHHDTQLPLQSVNAVFEEKLAQTLFLQTAARTRWWQYILSWPRIIFITGVATVIVLSVYFSQAWLQPAQTVLQNIQQELFEPKIALADAFDNTFMLIDNTQFRYQKIHLERFIGADSPFNNTLSVWTNNNNIRFNQTWKTDNMINVIDTLISRVDKQSCSYSNLNPEASEVDVTNCIALSGEENMDAIAGVSAVQQQYRNRFSNALFVRDHMRYLDEPTNLDIEYQGQAAKKITYQLPSSLQFPEPELIGVNITTAQFIVLVMDQKIVEYTLFSGGTVAEHVTVLEDKIITNQDPNQFFSVDYWKQAVGLKDENITDEPLKMERPAEIGG